MQISPLWRAPKRLRFGAFESTVPVRYGQRR